MAKSNGQIKNRIAHLYTFLRKSSINVVTEKEKEACPEKKLKPEGLFRMRIRVLISSVLLGLKRST